MRKRWKRILAILALISVWIACLPITAVHAEVDGFVHVCDDELAIMEDGNIIGATYSWNGLYHGKENTLRLVKSEKIDVEAPLTFDFAFGGYPQSGQTDVNQNIFSGFVLNELDLKGKPSPDWETISNLDRAERAGQYVGFSLVIDAKDEEGWDSQHTVRIHTYANGMENQYYAYVEAFRKAVREGRDLRAEITPKAEEYEIRLFYYDSLGSKQLLEFVKRDDWSTQRNVITISRSTISESGKWSAGGYPALGIIYQNWTSLEIASPSITLKNVVNSKIEKMELVDEKGNTSGFHANSFQLSPRYIPVAAYEPTEEESAVTFTSSNENVAKVDSEGNVVVVGIGAATITASGALGTATYELTVPVDSLTVDETEKTLRVGESFSLGATTVPAGGHVTFLSSNPEIASVDVDGTVKALAAGDVIITATCGEKRADCAVTVQDLIKTYQAEYEGTVRYGQKLDREKLLVNAIYDSGRTERVEAEQIIGFDSKKLGEQTVKVVVNDIEINCKVTIVDYVISLEIESQLDEVKFGESIDLSKLCVNITYASGKQDEKGTVTAEEISGFQPKQLGEQTVTVTKDEISETFTVTVVDYLTDLRIEYAGGTVEKGGEIDLTQLSVTAIMASGAEQRAVISADMLSNFDSQTAGSKTVTVTYEGMEKSFTVIVADSGTVTPPDEDKNGSCESGCQSGASCMIALLAVSALFVKFKK